MLKICLSRKGKTKQPVYRIVVTEKHRDPWGDVLEIVGFYNPRSTPKELTFKKERIEYWMSKGAQPSVTLHNMLVENKIIEGKKRRAVKPKPKPKAEGPSTGSGQAATPAAAPKEEKKEEKPAEAPKA